MKKKYTRPTVVKVKLSHEQAVLGTCSSGASGLIEDGNTAGQCRSDICKQDAAHPVGDAGASS